MAYVSRRLRVPLGAGLNTKVDPKALPPVELLALENGVFTRGVTIVKRYGYDRLGTSVQGSGSVAEPTTGVGLASLDRSLLMFDGRRVLVRNDTLDAWVDRGPATSVVVDHPASARLTSEQTAPDAATADGLTVLAWQDARGGVRFSAFDAGTGAVVFSDALAEGAPARCPKVRAANGRILLFWHLPVAGTTARVRCIPISPRAPFAARSATPVDVVTDVHAGRPFYQVTTVGSLVALAYANSSGNPRVGYVTAQGVVGTTGSAYAAFTTVNSEQPVNCLDLAYGPEASQLCLTYVTGALGSETPRYQLLNLNLTTARTVNYVDSASGSAPDQMYVSVPLYVYPTSDPSGSYNRLANLTPTVRYVIGNPNSGPGSSTDANYVAAWTGLRASGAFVLGYVDTSYANRDIVAVKADVDTWYTLYPGLVDGIFFDQSAPAVSGGAGSPGLAYYQSCYDHVKLKTGLRTVAMNPGASTTETFLSCSDLLMTFEGDSGSYGSRSVVPWETGSKGDGHIWHVVYGLTGSVSTIQTVLDLARSRNAAHVYLTSRTLAANPWSHVPDYLETEATLLAASNTSSLPVFQSDVPNVTCAYRRVPTYGDAGYDVVFYWESTGSNHLAGQNSVVRRKSISNSDAAPQALLTGTVSLLRHSGLASRAWAVGADTYVNVSHQTPYQPTYFAVRDDGLIVAKVFPGYAGGHMSSGTLADVQNTSGSQHVWAATFRDRFEVDETTGSLAAFSDRGARTVRMDFASPLAYRTAELDRHLFVGGGVVTELDGNRTSEVGFHVFPEGVITRSGTTAGSALTLNGTYGYRFYWEAYDVQGCRTVSTAAEVNTVTLGATFNCVTASVPSLAHTMRSGSDTARARLAAFRTTYTPEGVADGTFFRVDDPTAPVYNDPNSDYVTFVDTVPDATARTRELDYQNVEPENVAPPSGHLVAGGKDRLFVAGVEDPCEVRYSKPRRRDASFAFADDDVVRVDTDGGSITALAVMDDQVVVFKRKRIFTFNGPGPDALGVGSFSAPELVTSDVGCVNPRSVAVTPAGVMFQSAKGIHLLGRDGSLRYVGDRVEAFNGLDVTSTDVFEDRNQVIFLTATGVALLYDYHYDQWSTFTGHRGVDGTVADGVYHYLRADASVMRQASGSYRDDGDGYPLRIRTGWIRPADSLQDFGSFRSVVMLGDYGSPHRLRVRTFYDYRQQHGQERSFYSSASLGLDGYGDGTYGSGSYGGGDPVYQYRMLFSRPRAQAVSLEFQDVATDDGFAESYSLTELAVEVGLVPGVARVGRRRTQ